MLWRRSVGHVKKCWCYQERDEAERAAWVEALEAVAVCDRVYVDETGCDERLQREYGWSPCGEPCFDRRAGHADARFSVVSAWQSERGLIAPLSFDGTCHHRLFELWLRVMLCPLLRKGQVVILDKVGCRALFLPAYSPDLNAIEHQRQGFKTWVCNYRIQGLSLKDVVETALA